MAWYKSYDTAVLENHFGKILWRSGERLIVEKAPDRFTLTGHSREQMENWISQLPVQLSAPIGRPSLLSAKPELTLELLVETNQLDAMMTALRQKITQYFSDRKHTNGNSNGSFNGHISHNVNQSIHITYPGYVSHVYYPRHDPGAYLYCTREITLQCAPQIKPELVQEITQSLGLVVVKPIVELPNTVICQLTAAAQQNPLKLTDWLMAQPEIWVAEPNILVRQQPHYHPYESLYPQQWDLHYPQRSPDPTADRLAQLSPDAHINAEAAWDITKGDRAIVVAVIDEQFDLHQPDFQGIGKLVAPKDLRGQDLRGDTSLTAAPWQTDLPGEPESLGAEHGTTCARVAIAEENGFGTIGVAPDCALMPIRTTGWIDDTTIEASFDWAVAQGAAVICCSWGVSARYYPLSLRQQIAIQRAAQTGRQGKGCVIVFSAGNANRPLHGIVQEAEWPDQPWHGSTTWRNGFAIHPSVIAVSACTSLARKAAYSNWGPEVSVCAPSNNAHPWFTRRVPKQFGLDQFSLDQLGSDRSALQSIPVPPLITTTLPGLGFEPEEPGSACGDSLSTNLAIAQSGGTSHACALVAGVAALVLSINPHLTAQEVRQILQQTADAIADPDPDPQLNLRKGIYNPQGHCDWFGHGKVNAAKAVSAAQQLRSGLRVVTHTLSAQSCQPMPIPEGQPQGLLSKLEIETAAIVADVQVSVDIQHFYLGDVEVRLISPAGTVILLQDRTLGRQTQLQHTYTLETTPTLGTLLGQSTQGAWHLQIVDEIDYDCGTLNGWQLTLGIA